jgi:hypothetical protein
MEEKREVIQMIMHDTRFFLDSGSDNLLDRVMYYELNERQAKTLIEKCKKFVETWTA